MKRGDADVAQGKEEILLGHGVPETDVNISKILRNGEEGRDTGFDNLLIEIYADYEILRPKQVRFSMDLSEEGETPPSSQTRRWSRNSLDKLIEEQIQKLFQEEQIRKVLQEIGLSGLIFETQSHSNKKLTSLLKDWIKSQEGQEDIRVLSIAVNKKYKQFKSRGIFYSHRQLKEGDLVPEVKALLLKRKQGNDSSERNLEWIEETITNTLHLSGKDFISLIDLHLQTNEDVHIVWTQTVLDRLKSMASDGHVIGGEWVTRMCDHIQRSI